MLNFVRRTAFLKGVLGGNRAWFALWTALYAARLAHRLTSDRPEVVFRQELGPREGLLIRSGRPDR